MNSLVERREGGAPVAAAIDALPQGAHVTRTTNARIAGFTFLVYIAARITSMVRFAGATAGDGVDLSGR
jgi:hypothetical protein